MSDPIAAEAVRELVAALGGRVDVRITPAALLAEVKREIDRVLYADRPRAARLADAAARLADRLDDRGGQAFATASQARLLHAEARYGEAERLYARAAHALAAEGLDVEAAALAKQRVEALMLLGRYSEAFAVARDAGRVLRTSGDSRLLAQHETNLGNLYYHLDRYRPALACYERARAVFDRLGDPVALAQLDQNLGAVHFELDRPDEALEHYGRAAAAYRENGVAVRALQVELAAGYVDFLRGHYRTALGRLTAAREAGRGVLNDADLALTDLDLSEIYLRLNAFPEAAAAASAAAAGFAEAGMTRELGCARRFEAAAAVGLGDAARGAELLAEVVGLFEHAGHTVQAALARLDLAGAELLGGEAARAAESARAARRTLARAGLAAARRAAKAVEARARFAAGDPARASRLAREALREATAASDAHVACRCHHLRADLALARGRRRRAIDELGLAVRLVERMRSRIGADDFKSRFLEDKLTLFETYVGLCLEAGDDGAVDEVFAALELSKSRSLADLLSLYTRDAEADAPASEQRRRFARLVDELAMRRARLERIPNPPDGSRLRARRMTREIEESERRVAEAFRALQVSDGAFAGASAAAVVAPGELCALLGEGEALVEFAATGGRISAVVATRDGLATRRGFAGEREVAALVDGFRAQVALFAFGDRFAERQMPHLRRSADGYLAALYDALVRPLEPLVGDRDLVVVPHGPLHHVPVHALFDGARYVVERRAVSYAPSATVFALCSSATGRRGAGALVCGVPDERAPEIAGEVDELRRLFDGAHVLSGADATRAAFAAHAPGRRIVHVAAHGRFRADNPMLSSISLADGELTFYDVAALELSAELVALSGCNTGEVAVGSGDELYGLARGFLGAGASSLLLSMWSADDAATAGFMRDFYRTLGRASSVRAAWRSAQLAACERHGHPYYWAPFILLGRPG